MTVAELIENLQAIEDKELTVRIESDGNSTIPTYVSLIKPSTYTRYVLEECPPPEGSYVGAGKWWRRVPEEVTRPGYVVIE